MLRLLQPQIIGLDCPSSISGPPWQIDPKLLIGPLWSTAIVARVVVLLQRPTVLIWIINNARRLYKCRQVASETAGGGGERVEEEEEEEKEWKNKEQPSQTKRPERKSDLFTFITVTLESTFCCWRCVYSAVRRVWGVTAGPVIKP